ASQNLPQALADINQALELAPRYSRALHHKGRLLQKMNDLDNAEATFRQALVVNPQDNVARRGLIRQLKHLGRHPEAEAELRQLIKSEPIAVWGHHELGINLRRQNKLEEAVACFHRVIEL